jgi:hypothetical protein
MQKCGFLITRQQLKMKVGKLTQTTPTPFKHGIPRKTWWYWFSQRHPKISIRVVEGLEISRAQGLTIASYNFFYNLQRLHIQHNYKSNHI